MKNMSRVFCEAFVALAAKSNTIKSYMGIIPEELQASDAAFVNALNTRNQTLFFGSMMRAASTQENENFGVLMAIFSRYLEGDFYFPDSPVDFNEEVKEIRNSNSLEEETGRSIPASAILNSYLNVRDYIVDVTSLQEVLNDLEEYLMIGAIRGGFAELTMNVVNSFQNLITSFFIYQVIVDTIYLDSSGSPDSGPPSALLHDAAYVIRFGIGNFERALRGMEMDPGAEDRIMAMLREILVVNRMKYKIKIPTLFPATSYALKKSPFRCIAMFKIDIFRKYDFEDQLFAVSVIIKNSYMHRPLKNFINSQIIAIREFFDSHIVKFLEDYSPFGEEDEGSAEKNDLIIDSSLDDRGLNYILYSLYTKFEAMAMGGNEIDALRFIAQKPADLIMSII